MVQYPESSHRIGKVIILSKHDNVKAAYKAVSGGFRTAKKKGYVTGKVEFWYYGKIIQLN